MFKTIHTWPLQSVKVMEVVQVKVMAGKGTEEEPSQLITHYFDKDGNWLAQNQPLITLERPSQEEEGGN